MTDTTDLSADLTKAKNHALKFISFREHSSGELLKKLGKHYDEKTCLRALRWVREMGWQDDVKYAEKYAAALVETKRHGVRKARWEMKLKGFPDELINAALEKYDDEYIEKIIIEIIERKYNDLINSDDYKEIKKITDALMRRGYEYDNIKEAVAKARSNRE